MGVRHAGLPFTLPTCNQMVARLEILAQAWASRPSPRTHRMDASTDRIERRIHLNAPRDRVWRALADAPEFGRWFGVDLEGQQFVAGETVTGRITHPGYEHVPWRVR